MSDTPKWPGAYLTEDGTQWVLPGLCEWWKEMQGSTALTRLVDCPQFWEWYFEYLKPRPREFLICAMGILVGDPSFGPLKLFTARMLYHFRAIVRT